MSTTQIFVVAVIAIGVLALAGLVAVAVAARPRPQQRIRLDPAAIRRDRLARRVARREGEEEAVTTVQVLEPEPVPDPLQQREEVSEEEFGVTRRMFFNRSLGAVFGVFLLQFTLASLAFLWPKLRGGGFGSKIEAGDIDEIRSRLTTATGSITPLFIPSAQAYIVPFMAGDPEDTQFGEQPVIVGGVMALWQRCVHLGCRVPVCLPSQGFECPCHGSKYNFHGEYEAGPAPRNLDRFLIEVSDSNKLIIDTGSVIQTARAKDKSIQYPQGPSCLSATEE